MLNVSLNQSFGRKLTNDQKYNVLDRLMKTLFNMIPITNYISPQEYFNNLLDHTIGDGFAVSQYLYGLSAYTIMLPNQIKKTEDISDEEIQNQ